ncbi:hypothetical protein [Providencia sneebia]|uniref:Uncharacterized protein n=1 Tax=Providencia sneebia DSM 19967 TaxID=1141660 RepID=K8WHP9_9GAMM|nr:hypothetical protein [Providencia sneebia]EKT60069.1 hypothetical protein OO7_04524 [Providencia sneebia DSM 19967]
MKKGLISLVIFTLISISFFSIASNSTPSVEILLDKTESKFMREISLNSCHIDRVSEDIILFHMSNQEVTVERMLTSIVPSIFNLFNCNAKN